MRTRMRGRLICVLATLCAASFVFAQKPAVKTSESQEPKVSSPAEFDASESKAMFEAKIRTEWEALKQRDKKAYGDLLANDYEGVETDGTGERTKLQAINEVPAGNVYNYTLWGFRVTQLGPNAFLVIYEVTIQFPARSAVRYSRLYISEVWVNRTGKWEELHYQETHVK